eukprot:TRINITY_DN21977_c0_g1_i1.p1 TRINITY_DN21977_c0_g1~~TRINITY_DN21977_c0_g1_i1.p1  ORF type:complete len:115 (-),score=15.48 TRINITY_DN21977_c0_g1_i1:30-374(-)
MSVRVAALFFVGTPLGTVRFVQASEPCHDAAATDLNCTEEEASVFESILEALTVFLILVFFLVVREMRKCKSRASAPSLLRGWTGHAYHSSLGGYGHDRYLSSEESTSATILSR